MTTSSNRSGGAGATSADLAMLKGSRSVAFGAGGVSLAIGIAVMVWPEHAVNTIAIIIGLGLFLGGVAGTVDALFNHRSGSYWGLLLAHGLLNVFVGLATIFYPNITVAIVCILVGINLMIGGAVQILLSRQVPPELEERSRYLWRGILWIVFGIIVVAIEGQAASILAFVTGAFFALAGVMLVFLGMQLGKAEKELTS